MTVLVSGATSQIGRFLLPRLAGASGVQAVSRQPQPAQDGVQWLCGDLAAALDSVPSPDWQAIASFGP
jgi:NAD(P)-dependent dehydrogenase (short-subunit alcohol dehydrogenase family)